MKTEPFAPHPDSDAAALQRLSDNDTAMFHMIEGLHERVQGEAEARSHLAGQFHEALAELVEFAVDAHVAITLSEANISVLTRDLARLTDSVEKLADYTVRHFEKTEQIVTAQSVALRAVWDVTKPRMSRWSRLKTRWQTPTWLPPDAYLAPEDRLGR